MCNLVYVQKEKQIIRKITKGGDLSMAHKENKNEVVNQPLMSTGTTEVGFSKENKQKQPTSKPKIGESLMGDNGITGRIR